jgi:hypothetical protein
MYYNIKTNPINTECVDMSWIKPVQDRVKMAEFTTELNFFIG